MRERKKCYLEGSGKVFLSQKQIDFQGEKDVQEKDTEELERIFKTILYVTQCHHLTTCVAKWVGTRQSWENLCFISSSATDIINTRSRFFTHTNPSPTPTPNPHPLQPTSYLFNSQPFWKKGVLFIGFNVLPFSLRREFLGRLTPNTNNLIIITHFKHRLIVPLWYQCDIFLYMVYRPTPLTAYLFSER